VKKSADASVGLSPNQIVRQKDGHKFFGFGPTTLAAKIANGEIPAPVRLGVRARGWLGSQIIEWQQARLCDDRDDA